MDLPYPLDLNLLADLGRVRKPASARVRLRCCCCSRSSRHADAAIAFSLGALGLAGARGQHRHHCQLVQYLHYENPPNSADCTIHAPVWGGAAAKPLLLWLEKKTKTDRFDHGRLTTHHPRIETGSTHTGFPSVLVACRSSLFVAASQVSRPLLGCCSV